MKKFLIIGAVAGTISLLAIAALLVAGIAGYNFARRDLPSATILQNSPENLAGLSVANAQAQPTAPASGQGWGMMGRGYRGMMNGAGRGMMGGSRGGMMSGAYGPMHEYMVSAFAEALGLTPEEVQAELDSGKTMWQVAEQEGLTLDEFQAKMLTAREQSLKAAVEAGAISQEQADWMTQHWEQMQANGFGPGNCPGMGGAAGYGR